MTAYKQPLSLVKLRKLASRLLKSILANGHLSLSAEEGNVNLTFKYTEPRKK